MLIPASVVVVEVVETLVITANLEKEVVVAVIVLVAVLIVQVKATHCVPSQR